jgi:hypothetical protein
MRAASGVAYPCHVGSTSARSQVLAVVSKQRMDKHFPVENSNHSNSEMKRALRYYYIWRRKDRAARGGNVTVRKRSSAGRAPQML